MNRPPGPWPYLLLGVAILGICVAAWRPVPAGVWHDDGVYMLVGKALAGGHGFTYDGVAGSPPAAKFPPGYPVFLSVLWKLLGDIGLVTFAATILNLVFLAAAGGLFARALHEGAGLPLWPAVIAAAIGFSATDLIRTALVPLSEPAFLLLWSASLLAWTRLGVAPAGAAAVMVEAEAEAAATAADPEVQPPSEAALDDPWGAPPRTATAIVALLLVAAVMTRSVGVVLVIAIALSSLTTGSSYPTRARFAWTAVLTGPAFLASFLWGRWSSGATESIQMQARDLLGSYGGWLSDQVLASPGAFVSGLPSHALGVGSRAAAIFIPGLTGWPLAIAALVVAPVVGRGIWCLLRRFPPLGWFILGYVAVLLLWPYLDRRLLVPLHPALAAAAVVGATDLYARLDPARWGRVAAAVASAWVLAFSVVTAYRVADGWPAAPYRLRAERLATAVEALQNTARPNAVVGAPEFWAALHLHGGWTVAPSVRFDPRSVDPQAPMWGTPDEQITLWRDLGIDHLVLEQAGQLHSDALDQLEAACPQRVFVLAQMPGSLIVYLDWASACGAGQGD